MMAEPGRFRDGDAGRTVPGEIAANGRIRDDGDGRDDDPSPLSGAHRLSMEQAEEYEHLVREGMDPASARAMVRVEGLDTG